MRTIAIMIAFLCIPQTFAQEIKQDTSRCAEFNSYYFLALRDKNYELARYYYPRAYVHCGPTKNIEPGFFINGKVLYSNLLKDIEGNDISQTKNIQDTLIWVYEQKMQLEVDPEWELSYATFLLSIESDQDEKISQLYEKNISILKEKTSVFHLTSYFKHLIKNEYNKSEDKGAAKQKITDKYFDFIEYMLMNQVNDSAEESNYQKGIDYLNKYFPLLYSDEKEISALFESKFEQLSSDENIKLLQIKNAIDVLQQKGAIKSKAYQMYLTKVLEDAPSKEGFYGLGEVEYALGNYKGAIEAYQRAIELDSDQENAGLYNFKLAVSYYKNGQYKAAFYAAKKVDGELKGKALKLCGDCIAATAQSCGDSTFDRNANYWLANDYYKQSKANGEEVRSDQYMSNAPNLQDCHMNNIKEGNSVTLSCWGESTIVRF
ncbi:tetratricopeptide repeat protein [Paracrocinitomix mangrovi]|uniref:tetratricopeptide repeat protein n=1 Tax=Paracrocinitomix mangrovi TaxID=2862509 RepID=UPI001C8EE25D|nr:tetratricopeptide repeat protein [Paracrocinitomix mangrovi]UKN00812.1 tetratricopeptide repeat protein [Paracrocinitomix mangrovi]